MRIRDAIVAGVNRGVTSEHGLIAHGRGEAFDYLLGERTHAFAVHAIEAAARLMRSAEHPVISVNGNAVALVPRELIELGELVGAPLEVNIFHASKERERAIRDLVRQTAPVVMLSDIESIVAIFFGLTPADLHTSRKSRTIALARGIAMYLARKHTDMSFPEIGRFMGNKNHSTVILASRRISEMLQANESARWMTPAGQKEQNLAILIEELEEQFGAARRAQVEPGPVL